ncbi:cupin domain-containing protein [Microbacterium protaetiae]|uniref:Cupin domain-containing protein n=1 Tax=Microbacterium protaetiae TaxID=2509458 RepID=A0A4P6EBL6_9MICO|nr:cupin domain-containing protein [Microbacterium protaetiae]QAY59592.1 cupin domain-containing protein [Microbacterium protaetiae]
MSSYDILEIGDPQAWTDPDGGPVAKRFIDKEIPTQYIGASANALEPGGEVPFWHSHDVLEEVYVFLAGRGQMAVGDDVVEVQAGSVVRVGPGVLRAWRALPDSPGALRWLCIRAGGDTLEAIGRDGQLDRERSMPWAE